MDHQLFNGKILLITGGTGSFGKHFTQYMLKHTNIKKVIIYSRDEYKQFLMKEELKEYRDRLRFFIGDIRDIERLKVAFTNVNYVVHAAAMKHVSFCEYNPFEAIKSNITGTQNVADAAIYANVEKLVGLSTDKAVNPVNLYGATKLAADKLLVAANSYVGDRSSSISVVRFGNFAGSRGSIIPIFQNLINQGITQLPITHQEMTRYWISLNQTCESMILALKTMIGGEIFIPKLPSFKVLDLAKAMLENFQTLDIGPREGERLHEVLIGEHDSINTYEKDDHYTIYPNTEWKNPNDYPDKGKSIIAPKEYNSLNNDYWLSVEDLKRKLKEDVQSSTDL